MKHDLKVASQERKAQKQQCKGKPMRKRHSGFCNKNAARLAFKIWAKTKTKHRVKCKFGQLHACEIPIKASIKSNDIFKMAFSNNPLLPQREETNPNGLLSLLCGPTPVCWFPCYFKHQWSQPRPLAEQADMYSAVNLTGHLAAMCIGATHCFPL